MTGGIKMPGLGPLLIIIGLYILLNTYGKMKRNKNRLAVRYERERASRNRRVVTTTEFRPARRK